MQQTNGLNSRPNFLIFIVDQMNSFSLGFHDNPDIHTPNLDRLCTAGVSFGRAYCSNPVCSPSRATLHTGLTPRQHGLTTNGCLLADEIPTLPEQLADAGYRTHCAGKIHLHPFTTAERHRNETPISWESRQLWNEGVITELPHPFYGYQTTDYVGGHVDYVNGDYVTDLEARHPGSRAKLGQESAYHTLPNSETWRMPIEAERHYNHWIADRSMDFLDSIQQGESFFLVTSFPDPHLPFAACRPYSEMYAPAELTLPTTWNEPDHPCQYLAGRNWYPDQLDWDEAVLRESIAQTYGMITHIDDNVGRVLSHLTKVGLADNTVIAFLSDHGEYLGAHHLLSKGPWPYEQVVRVPYIWNAPDSIPQGRRDDVVSLLDFAPTILDYAGISQESMFMRGNWHCDFVGLPGRSLREAITSSDSLDDTGALVEFDDDYRSGTMCRYRMLIKSRFKLTVYGGTGQGVLFDLEADPFERRNLWNEPAYLESKCGMLSDLTDRLAWTDRLDNHRYCGS